MKISNRLSPSLLIRCILMSVVLCPAATVAQPSPAHLTEEQTLVQIRIQLGQGRGEAALSLIKPFLARVPPPALIDQFTFLYAVALHRQGDNNQAIVILEQFLEEYPASPLIHKAQLRLGALYLASRQPKRAIALLSRTLNLASDETIRREAQHQLRRAYELQGNDLLAVQTTLAHMRQAGEAERGDFLDAMNSLILQKMDEPSLTNLLEIFPADYPGDLALIRLIELHTAHGDEILAERDIRVFLHQFPKHPYAQTATALLRSFTARIKAHRQVIAVVLPFSGTMKPFGTDAFRGVRLALEQEAFLGNNAVGLVVKDSARSSTQFHREVADLLEEFNPIALIGPLAAHEAQRLAGMPDRAGIPFITPTATIPNVKHLGAYWFSTAMTTPLQVKRLVEYAMRYFGYTRFSILAPQTTHGKHLTHTFQQTVTRHGGEVIAAEWYQPGTTDASAQIARIKEQDLLRDGVMAPPATDESAALADPHPVQDHQDEAAPATPEQPEAPLVYRPGFDALFLPGRLSDVAFLSAQLAFFDIPVPLLGTNGWNHPKLLPWGHRTLEGGLFGDALFLQSADPAVQHFVTHYRKRFQADPSIFSAQAYEAMRAVLDTIRQGATTGAEVHEQLSYRYDLPTLGGLRRFDESGILDRKVYMIQIRNGRLIQLN